MAGTSLTLAALATSAVTGLDVRGYTDAPGEEGFAVVSLDTSEGKLTVRVALNDTAESKQTSEILSQTALTEGLRSSLPFAVPRVLGLTRAGDSRAVVYTALTGDRFDLKDLSTDSILLPSLSTALAAIHELPTAIVQQQGLPVRSATEARADCLRIVERAHATRYLPETVKARWEDMLRSTSLWDFESTVIHGSFDETHIRISEDAVTGVVNWSGLSVGDPAADFAWLAGNPSILHETLQHYHQIRGSTPTGSIAQRALLWHELDIAKWLLYGVETHDSTVVEDAAALLDQLVGSPAPEHSAAGDALGEEEVLDLLEKTPDAEDLLSETAAYEALDDERTFSVDDDFAADHNRSNSANDLDESPDSSSSSAT